jgi:hypothetical protein
MVVFVLVWQVAQFILGAVVLVQLIYRLIYGAPNASLDEFRRQSEPVPGADRSFRQFSQRSETLAVRRLANTAYAGR